MRSIWQLDFKELVSPGIARLQNTATQAFARLGNYEGQLRQQVERTTGAVNKQTSSFSSLGSSVAGALGFGGALATVGALGYGILKVGNNMEQTRTAFNVLLGDVDLANKKIGELQKFADVSPFNTQEVFDAGQKLLGFGVANEKLLPIMNQLGDVSQGNAAKFSSMIDNYGKLVSAGRANTMDLNQFAIAGIPIWRELEKLTGKQGQALRKYVEQNGISVATIDKALLNLTQTGGQFFGMMDKQSQTTAGRFSTLASGFEQLGVRIFNAIQPMLNSMIDFGGRILPTIENALRSVWGAGVAFSDWMDRHRLLVDILAGAVTSLGTAYLLYQGYLLAQRGLLLATSFFTSAYLVVLEMQTGATLSAALAQLGLNAAFLANPITWVIGLIGALTGVLVYCWNHFEGFRKFLFGLWEAFKQVFTNIGNFFKQIFGPIFEAITAFKEGRYMDAASAVGKVAANLVTLPVQATIFAANGGFTNGVADAFHKGEGKGEASFAQSQKDKTTSPADNKAGAASSIAGGSGASASSNAGASSSGGNGGKGLVVHINNLVGEIHIHSNNLADMKSKLKEHVAEVLVGAVNDFELAI